jgi:hypothetical protein
MRFSRLIVESFRAIGRAEIDFGPALNIVYGPNDLGKSTLAAAIRAALLVTPGSSEGRTYDSWHSLEAPSVELTFQDAGGHYWRIRKAFGAPPTAELLHSKDGLTFTPDCKGRQVEEKLRTMLAWGIPSPGGKSATRGMPTSFLSKVLLADQTDTDAILGRSIADDPDDTGKVRLTKALASLAQDPLFKEVLAAAQEEVDRYFTQTGQRKRGKASSFTAASAYVKKLDDDLNRLRDQLDESVAVEEELQAKRDERVRAQERLSEAQTRLARALAVSRLESATTGLREIDAQVGRLQALVAEVSALEGRLQQSERELTAANGRCEAADAAVRSAEEAHRKATSEDAAREQQLRRAQLEAKGSELTSQLMAAENRTERITAAIRARADLDRAREMVGVAQSAVKVAARDRDRLRKTADALSAEVELARAVVAFTRWRLAVNAVEEADRARAEAAAASRSAEAEEAAAAGLDGEILAAQALLAETSRRLPMPDRFQALQLLERQVERAEASLGGGISVMLRPTAPVAIRARLDHQAFDAELSVPRQLEAERTIQLAIADLVEIEILAGSAEKRRSVEVLRQHWQDEAIPVLEAAGVADLPALQALRDELAAQQARIAALRAEAERQRGSAKHLRMMAAMYEQRRAAGVTAEEREQRREAIGTHDPQALETRHAALGKPSEVKAATLHQSLVEQQVQVMAELTTSAQAVERAKARLEEAEKRVMELDALFREKESALGPVALPDLDALEAASSETIRSLQRAQGANADELRSLTARAGREAEQASVALQEAQAANGRARLSRDAVAAAREDLRTEHAQKTGACNVMRGAVAALDREGAASLVARHERELGAFPKGSAAMAPDVESANRAVEAAQRDYGRAKEEFDRKEGALSQVGGNALRDELASLEAARVAAQMRERDLETEADAWKLLHETLRAVENEEGIHLGRALAGPVTARFEELTAGRYRTLRLDAELKAEGLEAAATNIDGDAVLEALSVGTRDQLATLVRLTIADQLRSAIVLDDHLVHSDRTRLLWFRDVLQRTAINTQVIVLTCRSEDYVTAAELPVDSPARDVAAGTIRTIDAARAITRYGN